MTPPHPRPIALGDNAVYALALAGGGVLLVDAGPDFDDAAHGDSWALAVAQAGAHGFAPADVRAVLLTHAHLDHAGLAPRWAEAGARILAGAADLPAVLDAGARAEAVRTARREELRRHGCPPDVPERFPTRGRPPMRWTPPPAEAVEAVADGATFALAGGATLRVVAAPGHTPGNLVAFVSADDGAADAGADGGRAGDGGGGDGGGADGGGDLYSGDTLLPGTIPTPGLQFPAGAAGPRWPSLPPFLESVRRLRALPVRRVLPGHGAAVDDPARLFERFEAHHARRSRRIRALLAERPDSAYGVAMRLFPHLPAERVTQAMTEAIGHLDVLLASGEATCAEDERGVAVYSTASAR